MGSFMKACFVRKAAVRDEFILEDRVEERAKEHSHIGEGGKKGWVWAGEGCMTGYNVGVSHEN